MASSWLRGHQSSSCHMPATLTGCLLSFQHSLFPSPYTPLLYLVLSAFYLLSLFVISLAASKQIFLVSFLPISFFSGERNLASPWEQMLGNRHRAPTLSSVDSGHPCGLVQVPSLLSRVHLSTYILGVSSQV